MSELPAERPAQPQRDPGAADIDTQVDLGWVDPQPEPEPAAPPPESDAPTAP